MKLSIVVPVYNVEKYLVKCISSLLHQDHDDYEIIVVDDGSPDRSIDLIEEKFSPLPNRVTIIHQENQGLSEARNNGFKTAKGEYVWFFDSDDWCEENVLADIISQLDGCDVLYFNQYYVYWDGVKSLVVKNNIANKGCDLSCMDFVVPAQFYIYRSDFLRSQKLSFEKGIYHEDVLFVPIVLYRAVSVKGYNNPVYNFFKRSGSISTVITPKHCYDLMVVSVKLYDFYKSEVSEAYKKSWSNNISSCILHILGDARYCSTSVQEKVAIWCEGHREMMILMSYSRKFPTKILGNIISFLPLPVFITYKRLFPFVDIYHKVARRIEESRGLSNGLPI